MNEPFTCSLCESGQYILTGATQDERVCADCGYVAGSGGDEEPEHPWFKWRVIRNTKFEEEQDCRKRVVGSYIHAYDDYGRA